MRMWKKMKRTCCILILVFGQLSGCLYIKNNGSIENKVSVLVERTTKSKREEKIAFKELALLGEEAVPYIVGHLKDMRPLPEKTITFEDNNIDSFEVVRHYRPETVHDALAAILNRITKQNFVFVYNGATPQERTSNIQQWTEWCQRSYKEMIKECSNEK